MSLTFNFFPEIKKTIDLKKLETFKQITSDARTQFFHTFERTELLTASKKVFEKYKERKTFVHIGIGGSSLGPEMLIQGLQSSDCQFIFINNIDPDEIHDQLLKIDFRESLFYFVSKSGGTAETLAALAIISNFLEKSGIEGTALKDYFLFATDPVKSELRTIAAPLGIECLEVPTDVGGRFSVLTPVGYLPALFAGINVDELLAGARESQTLCLSENQNNPLLHTCQFLFDLKKEKGIDQTVMMPYSSKLKYFSFWFTQLWAESLGKKKDKSGKLVNVGFTPIVGYGATDQHSQMQLFMEGPKDKCVVMIEVLKFNHDFRLSSKIVSNNLEKLSAFSLADLMKAEFHGTLKALQREERPTLHISITKNDAFHLGALIVFFESLTALMGHELMIDPFDQPGVEAGKIYAFEFLNQLK
jgi:glucose-6-phosphate isomerase